MLETGSKQKGNGTMPIQIPIIFALAFAYIALLFLWLARGFKMQGIVITQAAIDAAHLSIINRGADVQLDALDDALAAHNLTREEVKGFHEEIKAAIQAASPYIIAANAPAIWRKLSDNIPPINRFKSLAFFIPMEGVEGHGENAYGICCDEWFVTEYQSGRAGLCFGKNGINLGDKVTAISHWAYRDELFPQPPKEA